MQNLADQTRYRMKIIPAVVSMLDYFIPIPIAHFLNGLRLPLDHAFAFFLNLIQAQPAHVHPNAVRYVILLIILCKRVGVELFELILRTFFSVLRMNKKTFSLRPHPNMVTLLDPIPNKVLDWREKWLYVECNTRFPFSPLVKSFEAWRPVGKRSNYSEYDKKFMDFIKSELGDNPKTQTKVVRSYVCIDWGGESMYNENSVPRTITFPKFQHQH